ncbi:MAG: MBL fold metallo-hydrolase [Ardenticatenales bacterium]|nr:MBL fold metallo-hydrolase [Ardenticatenales bacterium]
MTFLLDTFVCPPFAENTYLVGDAAGEAVVIDPGGRIDEVLRTAELRGVRITQIWGTHSHIDHMAGVAELQRRTGAPFLLHPEAVPILVGLPVQADRFGMPPVEVPTVQGLLAAGDTVSVGRYAFTVRDTPGHAPGHVTFVGPDVAYEGVTAPVAFCGDVIFLGSIGRTDLPGGDYAQLLQSIEEQILTLDDATVLFSGHGPATTVGRERRSNPFVLDWLAHHAAR